MIKFLFSKLTLVGCCSLFPIFTVCTPALAGYSAIAQGKNGWGWASNHSTMQKAKEAAIRKCEKSWGEKCSASTAEDDLWYFIGGYCEQVPYTAASSKGWDDALSFMKKKAATNGHHNCYIDVEK